MRTITNFKNMKKYETEVASTILWSDEKRIWSIENEDNEEIVVVDLFGSGEIIKQIIIESHDVFELYSISYDGLTFVSPYDFKILIKSNIFNSGKKIYTNENYTLDEIIYDILDINDLR